MTPIRTAARRLAVPAALAAAAAFALVSPPGTAQAADEAAPDAGSSPTRLTPWPASGASAPAPWRISGLPRQKKPFTAFSVVSIDGRRALRIDADNSYGNLLHPLRIEPGKYKTLSWRWQIERLNEAADLNERTGDDTTVKLCALFDLPLEKVPFVERQTLRVARSRSDDFVPTATICYVWDNRLPVGTSLPSPFTGRLRYVVLQSGSSRVGQWVSERRDLAADFQRQFGKESGGEPVALIGIAVGADSDNTREHTVAHVADLVLEP